MPIIGRLAALIEHIWDSAYHVSAIFPEDTNETVTVTAPGGTDTFSSWAELKDDGNVTLSSKFASKPGHIVAILVEETSLKDVRYLLELSYGDDETVICRTRFMKLNTKMNVGHQVRIRSLHVPAGETIYYRVKCETGSATAEIHLRYFLEG